MTIHTMQFDSLHAMLGCIEATRDGNQWIRYQDQHQGSLDDFPHVIRLTRATALARTLDGLGEEIRAIDRLAQALSEQVPAPASIRRVPTWGRSGNRVSLNRVLSGNLQQAWRRTERQATPHHGRVLTLIVPCCFSAGVDTNQIRWTCASSLAYASLCAQAGYSLDIWACIGASEQYSDGSDGLTLVRLLAAGDAWNTQGVALVAHEAFLRRLIFRIWEQSTRQWNVSLSGNYGSVMKFAQLQPYVTRWAQAQGIDAATLVYGAHQTDSLRDEECAATWLRTRVEQLAA